MQQKKYGVLVIASQMVYDVEFEPTTATLLVQASKNVGICVDQAQG